MYNQHKILIIGGVVIVLWCALLDLTPWAIKKIVNAELAQMEGVHGRIEKMRLSILHLRLTAVDTLVTADNGSFQMILPLTHFSLDGSELFRFRIAGSALLENPVFQLDNTSPLKSKTPLPKDARFYGTGLRLRRLIPAVLQSFSVQNAKVEFVLKPQSLVIGNIDLNISNVATRARKQRGPGELTLSSALPGEGILTAKGYFDPIDPWPDAKAEFKIEGLKLRALAPLTREIASVDAEKGTLDVVGEVATSKGKVDGYVKPLFSHLDVTGKRKGEGFWRSFWEHLVQGVASIFQNDDSNKVAGKIKFKGDLTQPGVSVWSIFQSVFGNAFNNPLEDKFDRSLELKPSLPSRKKQP